MTPKEIVLRLIELQCIFQAQPRNFHQNGGIYGFLNSIASPTTKEDFSDVGYNEEKNDDIKNNKEPTSSDLTLETITDAKELIKHEAWFLGQAPPATFPSRIAGQIMSIGVFERNLLVRLEDIPWGIQAGEVKIACEYITGIDVKNGSLLIFSKVGNVAIQIHEITESQCII